jgi:outer membrane protein OmpA-like peptidoglycan-associated protein
MRTDAMHAGYVTIALGALASVAAWGLVACETTPRKPADFTQTRAVVEDAATRADVIRYASPEITRARDYLSQAETRGAEHGGDDAVAAHYAYLAGQIARIAGQRAQEQVARARIRAGELERERIVSEVALRVRAEEGVTALGAARTERGLVITLADTLFAKGRARLHPDSDIAVDQIARYLTTHPERRVQIEAFTDSVGAPSFNLEVSQSRADAIAMALIHRGIDAKRVRAVGYGEWFAGTEGKSGNRRPDRRVEVVLSKDEGVIPVLAIVTTRVSTSAGLP